MTEIVLRLRKCAEELSRIGDAMSKSRPAESVEADSRMGGDAQRVVKALAELGIKANVGQAIARYATASGAACEGTDRAAYAHAGERGIW